MLKISLRRFSPLHGAGLLGICLSLLLSQAVLALASPLQQIPILLPNGIPSPAPQVPRAYLPLIINRGSGDIFGFVTQDGQPAGNVTLNLRMTDGSSTAVVGTAVTDSKGYYQFFTAAPLSAGQVYQVIYDSSYGTDTIAGHLASWKTKLISSYSDGQNVNIGNFDIADVTLVSPNIDSSQTLPVTFSWVRRLHSTTDSYRLRIMDYTDVPPTYTEEFASLDLGYLDHFEFQSTDWPPGMVYSTDKSPHPYFWYVIIQAPDTGSGSSSLMWRLKFLPSP